MSIAGACRDSTTPTQSWPGRASAAGYGFAYSGGWRTGYHLATAGVAALARRESIYLEQRFSDHATLIIDYDFDL